MDMGYMEKQEKRILAAGAAAVLATFVYKLFLEPQLDPSASLYRFGTWFYDILMALAVGIAVYYFTVIRIRIRKEKEHYRYVYRRFIRFYEDMRLIVNHLSGYSLSGNDLVPSGTLKKSVRERWGEDAAAFTYAVNRELMNPLRSGSALLDICIERRTLHDELHKLLRTGQNISIVFVPDQKVGISMDLAVRAFGDFHDALTALHEKIMELGMEVFFGEKL